VSAKTSHKGDENVSFSRQFGRVLAAIGVLALASALPAFAADNSTTTTPIVTSAVSTGAGPQEVAQANPFSDVPPNSWAYQAIAKLAADGLIKGYPDGQFKGQRPITRYEAAVLVNRVVDYLEAKISAGQKVSADQMATVKALVDQFGPELQQVQAHLKTLDTQVDALGKQVATNSATLRRQQFHLYYFLRAPGELRDSVSGFSPIVSPAVPGCVTAPCPLPASTRLTYGNAVGPTAGTNAAYTGQNTFGTAYQVLRMVFSGNPDDRWSYAIRLEDRYYIEGFNNGSPLAPTGIATTTPNYCPSPGVIVAAAPTCAANSDIGSALLRINYAYGRYTSPGGFQLTFGRILPLESLSDLGGQLLGLGWADYFSGAQLGYIHNGIQIEAGYGFGNPGAQAPVGVSQQQMWAHADFDFIPKRLNLGASYLAELNNSGISLWNAAAPIAGFPTTSGLYTAAFHPNMYYGTVYGTLRFNDNLHLQAEYGHRFGIDPTTGASWYQPNAIWALGTLGDPNAPRGNWWAEAGFIGTGFNGASPETNVTGTTGYQQLYVANPSGYQIWYGGVHYKAGNNVDLSLIYQHFNLIPGTDMPASTAACPGCYLTADNRDAIFLQSLIAF
jgi:hypothetical protein